MTDSKVHINFFGGSPLNRLSWLRTSEPFLNAIVPHSTTRWILFHNGQPLMLSRSSPSGETKRTLAQIPTQTVLPLLGPAPYFSQGQTPGSLAESGVSVLEAARFHGPPVVFLGVDEAIGSHGIIESASATALPSSEFSKADPIAVADKINGTPYFSLDVSDVEKERADEWLREAEKDPKVLDEGSEGAKLEFLDGRVSMGNFTHWEAAVFAEARSLVDWNARNKFCPACGSAMYSIWAGWKLSCSSLLPWADSSGRKPCPTATGLHNFAHPRSDPVVIMAAVNEANDKILLGRNKKWPDGFWSAMAGFIEPGESLEDAVKREMWEEAGVRVWGMKYHSTQPWPFPANLMAGFYAIADPTLPLRTDLDNELEDAKWYTREEVLRVLAHPDGTNMSGRRGDPRKIAFKEDAEVSASKSESAQSGKAEERKQDVEEELPFRVPPRSAIAGVLISDWAHEKVVPTAAPHARKGNL